MASEPRVVLVVGGTGAIGAAACRRLAADGYLVGVGGRTQQRAQQVADGLEGPHAHEAVVVDLASEDCGDSVAAFVDRHDGLDALVNAAGVPGVARFEAASEAFWREVFDINVGGVIAATQAALPGLRRREGCVVNVSSAAGVVGSSGESMYAASKAALLGLTKSLALEFARDRIRVNAVAPGPIDTPFLPGQLGHGEGMEEKARQRTEKLIRLVPLRRLGRPDEVGATVAFLCDPGSGFITGQTISVGGGITTC